ncbi:hypothetical protein QBE52_06805 [Clostridiaceae bacterium 35-E11]
MFVIGCIVLMIGAMLVYKTQYILKFLGKKSVHHPMVVKLMGLGIAVVGFLMILYGEFPKSLGFMRIF